MRRILVAACLLLAACKTNEPCAGPTVALELTFFAPEFVKSLLVTYEGAGTFTREIHEVQGAPRFEIVLRDAPPEEEVTVKISAYENADVRGRLLGEGTVGPLVIETCARYDVELSDRFILDKDAGVESDAGFADAEPEDAAEPDAGEIPDTGADTGTPFDAGEPVCATQSDDDTLALFSFSNAEATGTIVTDEVSGIAGSVLPAQGSVASTDGPNACGDAAAFFGFGYISIPSDGLAPVLGSVDFYVRFDGLPPTQRQGIVSRDAQGQVLPGHLAFFRTCDGHLFARFQDTTRSVSRCSDRPLPVGQWVHVTLDFGNPGLVLSLDDQVATSTGTRLGSLDCLGAVACDGTGVFEPSGNQNPWILGADSGGSVEGTGEPVRGYFSGAIDQFRVSSARRNP